VMSVSDLLFNAPLGAKLTGTLAVVRSDTIEVAARASSGRASLRPGTPGLRVLFASSKDWWQDLAGSMAARTGMITIPPQEPRRG
jgi:hypothetical protein